MKDGEILNWFTNVKSTFDKFFSAVRKISLKIVLILELINVQEFLKDWKIFGFLMIFFFSDGNIFGTTVKRAWDI